MKFEGESDEEEELDDLFEERDQDQREENAERSVEELYKYHVIPRLGKASKDVTVWVKSLSIPENISDLLRYTNFYQSKA